LKLRGPKNHVIDHATDVKSSSGLYVLLHFVPFFLVFTELQLEMWAVVRSVGTGMGGRVAVRTFLLYGGESLRVSESSVLGLEYSPSSSRYGPHAIGLRNLFLCGAKHMKPVFDKLSVVRSKQREHWENPSIASRS
jgi:hypothetical protein